MDDYVEVDGSLMEGGGQIIRMSIAFSALLGKAIRLTKIRAGRAKPGLQAQHLNGIQLAAELCRAKLEGCQMQSTEVKFNPGKGHQDVADFTADTKTAGATTLLAQIALPYALLGRPSSTRLILKGGTNADFAPQIEDYSEVFIHILQKFGPQVKCKLVRKGYFPKGGGQVVLDVPALKELKAVQITEFGELKTITIFSSVNGTLPVKVAQDMAHTAKENLTKYLGKQSSVRVREEVYKEKDFATIGNGSSMVIVAETSTGCLLSSGGIGSRNKSPKEIGEEAAQSLISSIKIGACLDQHHQDQVIIFMALANGISKIRTGPLTLHTKTAIHVAEMLSGAKFTVEESTNEKDVFFIQCEGIHFKNELL